MYEYVTFICVFCYVKLIYADFPCYEKLCSASITNRKHFWLWTDGWHQVETIRCVAAVRAAAVSGDGKEAWQQMLVQFTEATTHYTQHES